MNQLKVNQQQTIISLYQQGWSKRRIARELGVDRVTVRRYLAAAEPNSPSNPQTGSRAAVRRLVGDRFLVLAGARKRLVVTMSLRLGG